METQPTSYDYIFKIILIGKTQKTFYINVLGSSNVGKTSLIIRFCDGAFTESYSSTIGIDFRIKTIKINGKVIKMQLWDTAGQERYQAITSTHYRGADGCICVYDLTNQESFEKAQTHMKKFQSLIEVGQEVQFLVGNKSDLQESREVSIEDAEKLAQEFNFQFMETSVKDNTNVENLFEQLGKAILEKKLIYNEQEGKGQEQPGEPEGINIENQQVEFKKKKTCC